MSHFISNRMEVGAMKKVSLLLLIISVIGSCTMAWAEHLSAEIEPWIALGSTGTVDDADTSIADTVGTVVEVKSTAPLPAVLHIRYSVAKPYNLGTFGGSVSMVIRFRDNGAGARVEARLTLVSIADGRRAKILKLDSDSFRAAFGFQTQSACISNRRVPSCPLFAPSCSEAYYVVVTLSKSDSSGNPGLELLEVSESPNPC